MVGFEVFGGGREVDFSNRLNMRYEGGRKINSDLRVS